MADNEVLCCSFCKYTTNRKYNLERHCINKHSKEILNNMNKNTTTQNVVCNKQNEVLNTPKVILEEQNEIIDASDKQEYKCLKCNKIYLTYRHLLNHEKKCIGIDSLTCPTCMKSFSSRQNKYHHIKRNTCKPRSIMFARTPNIQNITNNNCNNTTNNITNNTNIININNYGSERLDYLNYEKYLAIFKKNYDIPSALTEEIHFNSNFPENKNIYYNDKTTALVKCDNNNYLERDTKLLVEELISNKTRIIQRFAHFNKDNICESINTILYDEIIELLLKLIVKEPIAQYNRQIKKITDLIRNNKV